MIHESSPWKDQLLKDADLIDRWTAKARGTERGSILIERRVFVSAFATRKLIECEKVSSDVQGRSIRSERFDLLPGQKLDWWKRHIFWEAFDVEAPSTCALGVGGLLDTIVLSKVFHYASMARTILGSAASSLLQIEKTISCGSCRSQPTPL